MPIDPISGQDQPIFNDVSSQQTPTQNFSAYGNILQDISSAAPGAASVQSTQMSSEDIATYWFSRALYDLSALYSYSQSPNPPTAQIQELENDVSFILTNISPIASTNPVLQQLIPMLQDASKPSFPSDFSKTLASQLIGIVNDNRASGPNINLSNLSPDSLFYVTLGFANLLVAEPNNQAFVNAIWGTGNPNDSPSFFTVHFSQLIFSVLQAKNIQADGSFNAAGFSQDIDAVAQNIGIINSALSSMPEPHANFAGFLSAITGSPAGQEGNLWNGFGADLTFFSMPENQTATAWPLDWSSPGFYTLGTKPPSYSSYPPDSLPPLWDDNPSGTAQPLTYPQSWNGWEDLNTDFANWLSFNSIPT